MHERSLLISALAGVVLGVAALAPAQDQPPILKPKPKSASTATLLVLCDLACNWNLDGEAQGRIEAGASAKAKVALGEHIVIATTEDGLDKVQQLPVVKSADQKVVPFELQPVRDARLRAAQEARDEAARQQATREQAAREHAARDQAAREEAARVTWEDSATGLQWTKSDNGDDVTWDQANGYCQGLRLAGHSDWRLPTLDELQGIYDPGIGIPGSCCNGVTVTWHVKGYLRLSGAHWSSSQRSASGSAWNFNFGSGTRYSDELGYSDALRALCVRRSGE